MEFVKNGINCTCVKYFWAGVKFSRIKKNPQFSIFGQKCRNLCIFLGKIEKFGNLTGVKDLTNSMSGGNGELSLPRE